MSTINGTISGTNSRSRPHARLRDLDNGGLLLVGAVMTPFGAAWGGAKLGRALLPGTAGGIAAAALGAAGLAAGVGLSFVTLRHW